MQRMLSLSCVVCQTGSPELPDEDDNAVKEYLCIKAYLVGTQCQPAVLD